MKKLIFFFSIFIYVSASGQNLIPNPSFEEIDACQLTFAQLFKASPWNTPNTKTPDLFYSCTVNACEVNDNICVPENFAGNQEARTGVAYAGFFAGAADSVREYVSVPLLSPLIAGEAYVLTFFISLSDDSGRALDRIGAYFTSSLPSRDNQLGVIPQILTPKDSFISEKEGWFMIRDTMLAQGGETSMTVGNFFDEDNTHSQWVGGGGGAYYYVDDFKLVPIDQNMYIEGEEEICEGDSTTLIARNETVLAWVDSMDQNTILSRESSITVSPERNTTYLAFGAICSTFIRVKVKEFPSIELGNDSLLCEGEKLLLNAGDKPYSFLWQDGSMDSSFLVRDPGMYQVAASNSCGTIEDRVEIGYENCNCPVFFPSAFTPNQDGYNDLFTGVSDCPFDSYELKIFNRWGGLIFESNDPQKSWDGNFRGKPVQRGVYVYYLAYKSSKRKFPEIRSGSLSVIR
ncbi:MAG: gliding motility-associated C-terminal domain-containing protein [Bacteroidia bacterium]|nr:gliding motility-associated C-terminal domain-containing protein [Bacteroidia bacterium]